MTSEGESPSAEHIKKKSERLSARSPRSILPTMVGSLPSLTDRDLWEIPCFSLATWSVRITRSERARAELLDFFATLVTMVDRVMRKCPQSW